MKRKTCIPVATMTLFAALMLLAACVADSGPSVTTPQPRTATQHRPPVQRNPVVQYIDAVADTSQQFGRLNPKLVTPETGWQGLIDQYDKPMRALNVNEIVLWSPRGRVQSQFQYGNHPKAQAAGFPLDSFNRWCVENAIDVIAYEGLHWQPARLKPSDWDDPATFDTYLGYLFQPPYVGVGFDAAYAFTQESFFHRTMRPYLERRGLNVYVEAVPREAQRIPGVRYIANYRWWSKLDPQGTVEGDGHICVLHHLYQKSSGSAAGFIPPELNADNMTMAQFRKHIEQPGVYDDMRLRMGHRVLDRYRGRVRLAADWVGLARREMMRSGSDAKTRALIERAQGHQ